MVVTHIGVDCELGLDDSTVPNLEIESNLDRK